MTPEEILQNAEKEKQEAVASASANAPMLSEADIDARFTKMLLDEERQERERQEKIVQRKQLAQAIGDLGQSLFNDVIKASGGAIVTPRDVQQRYDKLDDKNKQIYDTYRARVDLIRERQRQERQLREKRAQQAKDKADDRAWAAGQAAAKRAADADEAEKNRKHQERIAAIRTYNHNYNKVNEPDYVFDFGGGEIVSFDKAEGSSKYANVLSYLIENNLIPDAAIPDNVSKTGFTQQIIDGLVKMWCPRVMTDPKVKSDIYKIVTGNTKDFRDPLLRSIESNGGNRQQPAYNMSLIPPETDIRTYDWRGVAGIDNGVNNDKEDDEYIDWSKLFGK
ncbi:MAG: hypothetical protein IJ640_00240 [Prevotella sp.]|nr:hypothetical protein [Prevotella sp.]